MMAPSSSHIDTPQHATFPFFLPSTTTTSSSPTSSPSLLLTTITCPISPPAPNRRCRQRKSSTNVAYGMPDEITLIPSRPAPAPPSRRTRRSARRPMHMTIRFKPPEEAGLWVVWEDKRGEAEAELVDEVTRTSEEELELVGLGMGLNGWDEDTCSRFSSPSPRGSYTSLSSVTDSLPTSVKSDTEDESELRKIKLTHCHGEFDGLFFEPRRKESRIEEDETWEFAYALENPRTPLKSDFGFDSSQSQFPYRTSSPGRRPPPLDLRVSTNRKPTRLTLPSLESPLTPTLRTATATATGTLFPALQAVTPPLSVTSSSHSSFASISPLTPPTANRDDASKLVHAFASFLMSCEEDPLEYIDAQDTSPGDSGDDAFGLSFPSPPRRSTVPGVARAASVKSPRASSRNGGVRSRSPSDDKIRSSTSTTFATPQRRSTLEAPKGPLPPVPSVPEQYRKRSVSSPLDAPERLYSPVPRRTAELRSCKALQTVTGLLDSPSSPIARSIPFLESQAALQDSPIREQSPLNTERALKSFLPCPELLPSPTSGSTTSGCSSLDSSFSSHSSQRSSRRALPSRGSLPEQWRPSHDS